MMAIEASLTGHFVLSTLHTNDAASAPNRLIDMGVQPFLIASSLAAILAQRLIQTLCNECKEPTELTAEELDILQVDETPEWAQSTKPLVALNVTLKDTLVGQPFANFSPSQMKLNPLSSKKLMPVVSKSLE